MEPTIYLVGPRASGKTSLGLALAQRLDRGFADTDALFLQKWGRSIADFVAERGWEAFRDEETRILEAVDRAPGRVVACGGGIVLRPRNRELLARGRVLYLRGDAALLAGRLARDPAEAQRPSLTGRPLTEEVAEVLAQRVPLYESVAHAILDAALAPEGLLRQAVTALGLG
jgi:shikimate kinase